MKRVNLEDRIDSKRSKLHLISELNTAFHSGDWDSVIRIGTKLLNESMDEQDDLYVRYKIDVKILTCTG